MNRLVTLWALVVLESLFGAVALARSGPVTAPEVVVRVKMGDDPRWAAPDWNDSDWSNSAEYYSSGTATGNMPARAGIYWVRFTLEQTDRAGERPVKWWLNWPRDEPGSPIDSIFTSAVFSFELYWDGVLLESSGRVGNDRASEIPGPLDHFIQIPAALRGPGPHHVAMRVSSYHYNFNYRSFWLSFSMENLADRLSYENRQPIMPLIGAVSALLIAAVCGSIYGFVDRRRSLQLLTILSLVVSVFYLLIAWRWLHNDPYPWLSWRYTAIASVGMVIGVLVPWLLFEHFNLTKRWWWFGPLILCVAAAAWFPEFTWVKTLWILRSMLGCSLLMAGRAIYLRRQGAVLVLIGIVIGLVGVQSDVRDMVSPTFLFSFTALVACLLGSVASRIRVDRRQSQQALVSKARLEMELLKKNLQPHFILNTLTALTEVIEQDAKAGVKLIDDLADEFRSLARLAGEMEIPLSRELEMCRAHLRMASVRSGRTWALDSDGVDETFPIPPAIFLTLIENGLVHQQVGDEPGLFQLRMFDQDGKVRFHFVSPGKVAPKSTRSEGGTGLRYVHARLEERFPGRWKFSQHAVDAGWETVVEIQATA